MKPIEEHARAGDQVRRAFYVDGYGRDLLALSFVRAPGRDPTLFVHFPARSDGSRSEPRSALVPAQVWDRLIEASEHFDRRLQPRPGEREENLCLHSWVYTVEAHDPESIVGQDAGIRRSIQDACAGGLAANYAVALADYALPLLPYCAALGEHARGNPGQLAECEMLEGDRIAAAEALRTAREFMRATRLRSPEAQWAFSSEAVLVWSGAPAASGTAGERWLELTRDETTPSPDPLDLDLPFGMSLTLRRAVGEGWGRVRVEALLHRRRATAPVTLIFERYPHYASFEIARAEVGPFGEEPR
ncbi:MAG TPA: hypothetical protein VGB54_10100 [Allosphingosinicella sp.]|jgi:hypothetical protein